MASLSSFKVCVCVFIMYIEEEVDVFINKEAMIKQKIPMIIQKSSVVSVSHANKPLLPPFHFYLPCRSTEHKHTDLCRWRFFLYTDHCHQRCFLTDWLVEFVLFFLFHGITSIIRVLVKKKSVWNLVLLISNTAYWLLLEMLSIETSCV